jgi:hypothetical protein
MTGAGVRRGGSVTLGGRRVPARRPRVRAVDGSGELAVSTHELFSATEIPGQIALERMLSGLTTCRHGVGLEPIGAAVTESATATSRSAVSRTTEIAHRRRRCIRPPSFEPIRYFPRPNRLPDRMSTQ